MGFHSMMASGTWVAGTDTEFCRITQNKCTLAEWPLSSDTSSLLLLANGEFIKSELQTLFEGKSESSLSTIVDVALGNLKSETCISDTRFTMRKVPLTSVHRYLVAK